MWLVFYLIMFIGVMVLMFHITIEFNAVDKSITTLTEKLKKLYERE
jgi:hypothetical protein